MVRQARGIVAAEVKPVVEETGVHHMDHIPRNPFELFKSWHTHQANTTTNNLAANALCLSTSSKDGNVSSRTLILRRLDEDGFVIMTDNRSKKSKQLEENPKAAMTFLFINEADGLPLSRQVRAEGDVKQLAYNEWSDIYEKEPLFCKIRALVCHQGQPVDWQKLKDHHDSILADVQQGSIKLEKPDHVVAYKLFPKMMEFYETVGSKIADRVMFLRDGEIWESKRIAA